MFRNYWTVAIRQLSKQKFYSFIKIGGFALGIATCLLIMLYIRHELSYDRDYVNGGRLYRVIIDYLRDDCSVGRGVWLEPGFAKAMKAEFPEVEQSGGLMPKEEPRRKAGLVLCGGSKIYCFRVFCLRVL